MSSELNDHTTISARIKKLAALVGAIALAMSAWFLISALILNDWPDHNMIGYACYFVGACAFSLVVSSAFESRVVQRAMQKASVVFAIIATILAIRAMVEFAAHGAPAMTSPMQNEWRAHFTAIGIITFCAVIFVTLALNWVTAKIIRRT